MPDFRLRQNAPLCHSLAHMDSLCHTWERIRKNRKNGQKCPKNVKKGPKMPKKRSKTAIFARKSKKARLKASHSRSAELQLRVGSTSAFSLERSVRGWRIRSDALLAFYIFSICPVHNCTNRSHRRTAAKLTTGRVMTKIRFENRIRSGK